MIGGTILSALVTPWFDLARDETHGGGFLARPRLRLAVLGNHFSLVGGYTAAMALGALRQRQLLWRVPLMPVYWLLIWWPTGPW